MKAKKEAGATKPTATKMEDLKLKDIKLLENINQLYNQIEISLNEKGIINTAYHLTPENFNLMGRQMLQDSQTILTKVWEKLTEKKQNAFIELYRKYPFIEGENGLNIYPFGYDIFFKHHLDKHYIHTNKVTSAIDSIHKKAFQPGKNGLLCFNYAVANDNITVEYNDKDNNPIDANAQDIFDLINIMWSDVVPTGTQPEQLVDPQNRLLIIPLERYMFHKGITDKKYARQKFAEGMLSLAGSTVKYKLKDYDKKDTEKSISNPLIMVYHIKEGGKDKIIDSEGNITIILDFDFAVSLTRARGIFHNAKINKIDSNKFPIARTVAKKLEVIYETLNRDIISTEALLKAIPALPDYETLKGTGEIRRKIIDPIEKSLEHLQEIGILKECAYYDMNKRPLPDSIIGKDRIKYSVWIKLYIHFVPGADTLVL